MTYVASFHNHTRYSDGTYEVAELVDRAVEVNKTLSCDRGAMIKGLTIVDHDFYPNQEQMDLDQRCAEKYGVELIFGTELDTDNGDVHVIGYNIDPTNFFLLRYLIKEQYKRLEAFEITCHKLNRFFELEGKTIDLDGDVGPKTLKKNSKGQFTGQGPLRWHYLRQAMVEKGMIHDIREADILIGPVGPCYHQRATMDSVTVVENILKWGGKPVLAHPHKIPERFRWRVINSLIEAGLAGIEAFTSSYAKPEESNIYARIAKENNLLILAGTDLHQNIDDIGSFLLPYERFEQLRNGDSPS